MAVDSRKLTEHAEVYDNDHPHIVLTVRNNDPSGVLFSRIEEGEIYMHKIRHESKAWENCSVVKKINEYAVGGHPRFLSLLNELRDMHLAKSADYGTDQDCYANYRKTASLGIQPSLGILIRMADKWSRIETWANGGTLCNEGVKDSLMDLAGYALAAITMIEEEGNK